MGADKPRHLCKESLPVGLYDSAINSCAEDYPEDAIERHRTEALEYGPGLFWVSNGEYGSAVRFCPFCGERAPVDPASMLEREALIYGRRRAAKALKELAK